MLALHALSTTTLAQPAEKSAPECFHGGVIEHSDRTVDNRCTGTLNDACEYQCQAGYIATGRHVCQRYEAGGAVFINNSFFGGSCRRLCTTTTQTCKAPQATIRTNATDAAGPCFATRCVADGDAALFNLLRGNLEVWRQARSDKSGFYKDSVNIIDPNTPTAAELAEPRTIESPTQELRVAVEAGNSQAATGVTGLGLITEVVALALGLQSTSDTIARVRLTLRSLVGKTPGVRVPRDPRGFFIHFMDADTGAAPRETTSCLMCTGLLMAGAACRPAARSARRVSPQPHPPHTHTHTAHTTRPPAFKRSYPSPFDRRLLPARLPRQGGCSSAGLSRGDRARR